MVRTRPAGFAKGSPFGRAVERSETERVTPGRNPFSHGPWPCQLPRRGRPWQRRKVYSLTADFFLSLNSEDETCRFCQGLPLSGELSSAARLRGFSQKQPSPSRLCRDTSPERERLWKGREVYGLQVGFFCPLCKVLALEGKDLPQPETKRGKDSGTHPLQPVLYFPEAGGPTLCAKKLAGEDSPAV